MDLRSGQVSITAQNHGFRVDEDSIPDDTGLEVALVNLNDESVEGLCHADLPVLSVQFHPEASPGPLDNGYLFDRFLEMMRDARSTAGETLTCQ